jgi:hypothetical protein
VTRQPSACVPSSRRRRLSARTVLTNADLAKWSTPPTSGSSSAPASASATSRPRAKRPPISATRRRPPSPNAGLDARRHRSHHLATIDAGLHLSGDRHADPGRIGITRGAPSICRPSAPASSSRWRPPIHSCLGLAQARPGDRRGDLLAHPRLERPHDLRAVRRRRRRDGAGGAARRARCGRAAC